MEKFDALSRMKQLVKELNENTIAYDRGVPVWTDKQWDDKYFELVELEHNYPNLILEDSPTQHITHNIMPELIKVQHKGLPMLSLDKTKDIEDVVDFVHNKHWLAMLKLDGLTCRLTYDGGRLIQAETRGDGFEGEDVTHNAIIMPSIPKKINYAGFLQVDGEVICDTQTFEKYSKDYANPRNFAAGSIRLLNSQECSWRGLTFVAWDCRTVVNDIDFLSDKLLWLYKHNFKVVPFFEHDDYESIEDMIGSLQTIARNEGYPIDGIVFKWDNCAEYEAAGRTDHHFRGGLAYKFYDDEYETTLQDIEWSMGRTGVLTPVAIFDAINIDGAEVSRASMHNLNTMQTLFNGPWVVKGQKIWVYKANQIIPQISKAQCADEIFGCDPAYFLKDPNVCFLTPPKTCPICGEPTDIMTSDSGTIELVCGYEYCPGKLINRLDHFCGKKGLDIKHLSKATLSKLIEWEWVKGPRDLFKLQERFKEWIAKPGFGEKSVQRILDSIEEARHCYLEDYIAALGIPLIGKTYAKKLVEIFKDYASFRCWVKDPFSFDIKTVEGFGAEKETALIDFDYYEADRMFDMKYVEIKDRESELVKNGNPLEGLTFVITGKLKNYKNRDLLKAEIEARGGKVVGSVSSKTSYLINNDSTSTSAKNKTAQSLGVKIITEEELFALWQ